jgi:alkylation response protein AidB-like acyl-CoA dehydrogenase
VRLEASAVDDRYVLDGVKTCVEAAGTADHLLVTARADGGLIQFLIPATTPGISIDPMSSLDLTRRFGAVRFDTVSVGRESVVGIAGDAAGDVERQRLIAMLLQCADTTGAVARVFEFTVDYAFHRFSFGRPLAS